MGHLAAAAGLAPRGATRTEARRWWRGLLACSLALAAAGRAQEIVKVPASQAPTVSRPDDLFKLPPGQWYFARQLWQGAEPCSPDQCEAGFTSGDLVVSVEHAGKYVRVMAGLRNCQGVAYSELETGERPGKSTRKKIAKQVDRVVKGLGKTCSTAAPSAAPLDAERLFPAKAVPAAPAAPAAPKP